MTESCLAIFCKTASPVALKSSASLPPTVFHKVPLPSVTNLLTLISFLSYLHPRIILHGCKLPLHVRKRLASGTQTEQSHQSFILRTFLGCAFKPRATMLSILHSKLTSSFPGISQLCRWLPGYLRHQNPRITGSVLRQQPLLLQGMNSVGELT